MFEAKPQTPDAPTDGAESMLDVIRIQAAVLEAIQVALDEAGIDMLFETQVMLVHDQTEEIDGSRGKQREGWPKRLDGALPRSAREAPKGHETPAGAEADRA